MGNVKKIGVGRKITYDEELEVDIIEKAMAIRECEDKVKISNIKKEALTLVHEKDRNFKGSDGWYKKFARRNNFQVDDKYQIPNSIPSYFYYSLLGKWLRNSIYLDKFSRIW